MFNVGCSLALFSLFWQLSQVLLWVCAPYQGWGVYMSRTIIGNQAWLLLWGTKHPRTSFVIVLLWFLSLLLSTCRIVLGLCLFGLQHSILDSLPAPPLFCSQRWGLSESMILQCNHSDVSLWLSTTRRRPTVPMCVCRVGHLILQAGYKPTTTNTDIPSRFKNSSARLPQNFGTPDLVQEDGAKFSGCDSV